jgi:outer membrane protein assembly factor BamB
VQQPYFGRSFLADANDDDMPDIVGHDFQGNLFAVDGRDGKILWSTHAADVEWFAVDGRFILGWKNSVFAVQGFDAGTGAVRWKRALTDTFTSARFGSGCVVVHTRDGKDTGLDDADGRDVPCTATRSSPMGLGGEHAKVSFAGGEVITSASGKGTPSCTIYRTEQGRDRWSRTFDDLTASSDYRGCSVAVGAGGIVVTSKLRSRPREGFVVLLLDPETGDVMKRADVATRRSIFGSNLLVQGRLLAVDDDGMVYGFDPVTLERRWTVGHGS